MNKYPQEDFKKAWAEVNKLHPSCYDLGYTQTDWNHMNSHQKEIRLREWRTKQVFAMLQKGVQR